MFSWHTILSLFITKTSLIRSQLILYYPIPAAFLYHFGSSISQKKTCRSVIPVLLRFNCIYDIIFECIFKSSINGKITKFDDDFHSSFNH